MYYGGRGRCGSEALMPLKFADYIRDTANLSVLCAGIWQALGEVIGDEETER